MGTAHEWIRVLIDSIFFGGLMGLYGWLCLGERFVKPSRLFVTMYCFLYAFGGLSYGLVDAFGNRSFRPPLLILQSMTIGCALALGFYVRKLARSHAGLPNYFPDSPLFGRMGHSKSVKPR